MTIPDHFIILNLDSWAGLVWGFVTAAGVMTILNELVNLCVWLVERRGRLRV